VPLQKILQTTPKPLNPEQQDAVPDEDQPELMDKISRGQFTMRIMYEQFANITKMGPMSQARLHASCCPLLDSRHQGTGRLCCVFCCPVIAVPDKHASRVLRGRKLR
jgi:hypothetical protein